MTGKLIVSEHGRDRVHEIMEDLTRVGTGPDVDLHLRDPDVGAVHCEIRRVRAGFKLIDLETAAGTMVNGRMVNQHLLQNGDTIRIGKARLTYLGDSASPVHRPRRQQPLVGLRAHPTDEEGRPRRFYRHEFQKTGISTGAVVGLILTGLGLIVLLLVWGTKTAYTLDAATGLRTARSLIRKGDQESVEEALRVLDRIPEGSGNVLELAGVRKEALARLDELKKAEEEVRAHGEYVRIRNHYLTHPEALGEVKARLASFREQFPESSYIQELEKLIYRSEVTSPPLEKAWQEVVDSLRLSLRGRDFKSAFATLKKAEDDPAMKAAFGTRIAAHRGTLEREFKRYYATMSEAALDAKARGDVEMARRIYRELAGVGCEPLSTEARRLLALLR